MNGVLSTLGGWTWNQAVHVWDTFTGMDAAPLAGMVLLLGITGALMTRLAWCGGRTLRIIATVAGMILWAFGLIAAAAWAWTVPFAMITRFLV